MKKLLLLIVILPLLTTYLHSQTELVIESFENWGSNGLPDGYEWYLNIPWPGIVDSVSGYAGSGVKVIDQYYSSSRESTNFNNGNNPIYYSANLPDSVRVYGKNSLPSPNEQQLSIFFMNGGSSVGYVFFSGGLFSIDSSWVPRGKTVSGDPNATFTHIEIKMNVNRGIGNNNEWCIYDEITLVWNVTSVDDDQSSLLVLDEYRLEQNFPNPFNPSTTIKYELPERSFVTIRVYDMLGNEIETLVNEEKQTGTYEITWNAENLPSGVYFYQLKAGSYIDTKKMLLTK